jgi:predicted GNAT family acetyltransferase
MDTPEITHHPDGNRGSFTIERDGKQLATMVYSRVGNLVIINHTEVDPMLRGTGAGARLVAAAVDWARADHLRIMAICPYAKSVLDKKPEYRDVLGGTTGG